MLTERGKKALHQGTEAVTMDCPSVYLEASRCQLIAVASGTSVLAERGSHQPQEGPTEAPPEASAQEVALA